MGLSMLMRDAVNVVDAFSSPAAVHQQMADNSIAHERISARSRCRRKRNRRTVEIRCGKTATLTLIAVMAGGAASMVHCQVCYTVGHDSPAQFAFDDFLRHYTATRERHRGQELAIWHLRQTFARTAHADEAFDLIVVRFKIFVANGPVFSVAIAAGGFEFVVAEAVAFARPTKCFPSHLPATDPHERFVYGKGVRMLQVIDKKLMAVLVTGITQTLDRLCSQQLLLIAKTTKF